MCSEVQSFTAPASTNLEFDFSSLSPSSKSSSQIIEKTTGLCVTPTSLLPGANLQLQPCSGNVNDNNNPQLFNYDGDHILHVSTQLVVDAGSHHNAACADHVYKHDKQNTQVPGRGFPFCDTSLSFTERVADLVPRLSVQEKAMFLSTSSGGSASELGIHSMQWWNEALHGLANNVGVVFASPLPGSTSFPMPILTSQSFNRTLFRLIGEAISTEARAFFNYGHGGLTFWAPNINLFRDPRCVY